MLATFDIDVLLYVFGGEPPAMFPAGLCVPLFLTFFCLFERERRSSVVHYEVLYLAAVAADASMLTLLRSVRLPQVRT